MPTETGPYKEIVGSDGLVIPWYMLPFDKRGRCKSPQTRAHLLNALSVQGYTHVFLFSHGWNNDWETAEKRYTDFANGFIEQRAELNLPVPSDYKPVMVGVFWPSTALILPSEQAPQIAGTADQFTFDPIESERDREIDLLAEDIPDTQIERFYALAGEAELTPEEVIELAQILNPTLGNDDELGSSGDASDLAEVWRASEYQLNSRVVDIADGETEFGTSGVDQASDGPQAAGLLSRLDPRPLLRLATVRKMKDRAGTVGAIGIHELLKDVLSTSSASVHLIGHSYGCKVLLSAVAFDDLPRSVTSVLLLQPAISHRAFSENVDGDGHSGGYRVALARISQPILSTYSRHDLPLRKVFHLAIWRKSDLGEIRIAADKPPSRFAALGGYGPRHLAAGEQLDLSIRAPRDAYTELQQPGLEIIALESSSHISGHGDVIVPATLWALHEQVRISSGST